jgi:hypothetical protein
MNKSKVVRWMKDNCSEFLDNCGEVNCTELAEAALVEFDAGRWLDDDAPEEFFDWAVDVAEWFEKRQVSQ